MAFEGNTRRKLIQLETQAMYGANPMTWDLPKTGILGAILLTIRGTCTGGPSTCNALGKASLIRRVRLYLNSGIDVINLSGPGYHYLVRDWLEAYHDPVPYSDAMNAVANGTFNLDMILPVQMNSRDQLGLIMLQNEDTLAQLTVEWEAIANVAGGGFVCNGTITPWLVLYTVPIRQEDFPRLDVIHQTIEESQVVAAAGQITYYWPRGNTYVSVNHGLGIGAVPADGFNFARVRVNQSDYIWDQLPAALDMEFSWWHGRARNLGVIPWDLIGSASLGTLGSARDLFYSQIVTDVASIIDATGAGTLYTVRRQLVNLSD